jgi:translocator protein
VNARARQLTNFLALIAVIAVNFAANALPFNNKSTKELSDQYEVLFTPAGYVFAIWGLIYLLLAGYAIYQALPSQANNPHQARLGVLFAVSSLLNGVWLVAWHYELLGLSVLIMLALFGVLALIYTRIAAVRDALNPTERLLIRLPFSVYFGWISVATIANISVLLWASGWSGWGISAETWTVIMMAAATAIAFLTGYLHTDPGFAAVVVWALAGIGVSNAERAAVANPAWGLAAVLGLATLWLAARGRPQRGFSAGAKYR